jgi:hypothetical protein
LKWDENQQDIPQIKQGGASMQYFDESDDKLERLGKVIGDIISAIIIVGLIAIFAFSLISR